MSKSFFFGLLTVYDWEWLWGRTAAQVELRTIDQPLLVYKKDDNHTKPGEKGYKGMSASEAKNLVKNFKRRKIIPKKEKRCDMNTFLSTGEFKGVDKG